MLLEKLRAEMFSFVPNAVCFAGNFLVTAVDSTLLQVQFYTKGNMALTVQGKKVCVVTDTGESIPNRTFQFPQTCNSVVLCPPRACLLARNGLVNKVEFLGLIPQKR